MLHRRLFPALPYLLLVWVWWQGWGLPALEDDRFWWIPQAYIVAENGPQLIPAGVFPTSLLPAHLSTEQLPSQWVGGIPDYGHPPLFYWYLGFWLWLVGPGMEAIRLGLLVLALVGMLGFQRLAQRLAPQEYVWQGAMLLSCVPVISVQLSRADLDMALLCLTPWALETLLVRRHRRFMWISFLAVWAKEPGVLLAAAAFPSVVLERRGKRLEAVFAMLAPLAALGLWALLHRTFTGWGLAGTERLPQTLLGWTTDLWQVFSFVLFEQGRIWLLPLLVMACWRILHSRSLPLCILAFHLAVHLAFFGTVNFLGGDPTRAAGGHLRYLIPAWISWLGLCLAGVVPLTETLQGLLNRWNSRKLSTRLIYLPSILFLLCTVGALRDWHAAPVGGVERNFFAHDLVRAHQRLVPQLRQVLHAGSAVWVGSYAWIELSIPLLAGDALTLEGLRWYGPSTRAAQLSTGDYVLISAHGEPLGGLEHTLVLRSVERVQVGVAWAELARVEGHR